MDLGFIPQSIPHFLTPDNLADILGISKTTVYRLIDKRSLPFYKIGGSLRFKQSDVMEYLEKSRIKPSNELL
ncbi:MAG: helix-turn-helix domain-containing protein [Candidatus Magasanikbacteria bacterium]|nr:helix-turn-helix domain-containing protein [Candidatus Magasanikbacteria bacterium]